MGLSLLSAIPHSVLFNSRNSFYRFHDESFTTIGVYPGDFAMVTPGPVGSGRMAAVRTPDIGDIVRVVLFEGDRIRLKPLNPHYWDLFYDANELHIAGPVVDVYPASEVHGIKAIFPAMFATEYPVPSISWAADPSGAVIEIAEIGEYAAGVQRGEMLNWGWQRVVHPEHRQRVLDTWIESIKTGKPYRCQFLVRTCIGRYRKSEAIAGPIYHDGQIVEWDGRWRII